jgi:hypothetical protein
MRSNNLSSVMLVVATSAASSGHDALRLTGEDEALEKWNARGRRYSFSK